MFRFPSYLCFFIDSYYFFIRKSIISCNYVCLVSNSIIFPVVYFISFKFKDICSFSNSSIDGLIWFILHLLHSTFTVLLDTSFMFNFSFYISFSFWYIIFIKPFNWFSNDKLLSYFGTFTYCGRCLNEFWSDSLFYDFF